MSDQDRHKFEEHFGECNPCLEKYGLEQAVKKLVKRCCGHDDVPGDLRSKVLTRIQLIRAGDVAPGEVAHGAGDSGAGASGETPPAAGATTGPEPA